MKSLMQAKSDSKTGDNFIRPEDVICLRMRVAEELIDEVERCMKKKHNDVLPAFRSLINTASESANLTIQVWENIFMCWAQNALCSWNKNYTFIEIKKTISYWRWEEKRIDEFRLYNA